MIAVEERSTMQYVQGVEPFGRLCVSAAQIQSAFDEIWLNDPQGDTPLAPKETDPLVGVTQGLCAVEYEVELPIEPLYPPIQSVALVRRVCVPLEKLDPVPLRLNCPSTPPGPPSLITSRLR